MADERDLAPGEWSVLALLAEKPGHGWALAKEMSPGGEVGRVWSVGRPLVYRALEFLDRRGLAEVAGHEPGARGPNRELFRATDAGRDALGAWLAAPVDHVRDIRSVFLLKLVLLNRAGMDPRPLLEAQREVVAPVVAGLRERLRASAGSERIFLRFRLETTVSIIDFIDRLLTEDATRAAPEREEEENAGGGALPGRSPTRASPVA